MAKKKKSGKTPVAKKGKGAPKPGEERMESPAMRKRELMQGGEIAEKKRIKKKSAKKR